MRGHKQSHRRKKQQRYSSGQHHRNTLCCCRRGRTGEVADALAQRSIKIK